MQDPSYKSNSKKEDRIVDGVSLQGRAKASLCELVNIIYTTYSY